MQSLPMLYYEVRLARIQVEYLLETARTLLRPWPDRDSRGRVKSTKVSVEPPQEAVQDVVSHELEDLKVLDEVLAKARHVKVQHKASLAPYMATTKSDKTRAKRVVSKSAGDKAGRAHSKEAVVTHVVKHSSSKDDSKTAKVTKQTDGLNPEQDTFTVADHGNMVNLPSKWSRLHNALSKLADEKAELKSKMNGNHFVEKLQQQRDDNDINHLIVIQAQLLATIDDVTSIPVEQWTINNRTWQALYRVHRHLELIQQSTTLLGRSIQDQPPSTHSTHTATCSLVTTTHHHNQHVPLLSAVAYSSLQGLLEYVEACVTLQHRSCEVAIAQLCQREVIPALLSATMETDGLTTTIRHIYSILDKSRDTVFLYDKCH